MKREQLSIIISNIDDGQIAEACEFNSAFLGRSPERITYMSRKRIILFALAAALIFAFGTAAYAAGWFAPIFHSIRYNVPEAEDRKPGSEEYYAELEGKNAVMEAAEQYMNEQQPAPETVSLPELDNCEITLLERYYDGRTLVLGFHLESDAPQFAATYDNEEEIREKATTIAFADSVENDNIDTLEPVAYDEIMASRSDNAVEHGLCHVSSIVLDSMLFHELSPEEYEAAWEHLLETGHLCIVRNDLYVSDHILMEDGTDLGQTYSVPVYEGLAVQSGNVFFEAPELPDAAQGLDSLSFQVNVRIVRSFYYMELDGSTWYYSELVSDAFVPFCVDNAER